MRIPGKRVFKSFSVYAFAMFFNAGISFIVFSWLTHKLTPEDLGIVNLYSSYGILLVPFISTGVQFILSVDYFKMNKQQYVRHFDTGLAIPFLNCLVITALSFLFLNFLKSSLKVNAFFVLIAPFTCMLIVYNDIVIAQIRNRGKHNLFARYTMIKTFAESLFTVLLVVFFVANWQGRLGGALIAFLLFIFINYYLLAKWELIRGEFDKDSIFKIARQGLPFVPERLAIFFLSYSDRFFINYFRGPYDVGLYSAGTQVGTVVNLITMALSYTFQPVIFRHLSAASINYRGLRNVMLAYIGISLLISIFLIVTIPFIFRYFIGNAFRGSSLYAINLTISGFFWAVYNTFLSCLLFRKRNKEIMIIAISGTLISIVLNILTIQSLGPVGATYTSIIVNLAMAVFVILRVHYYYDLKKIFRFNASETDAENRSRY